MAGAVNLQQLLFSQAEGNLHAQRQALHPFDIRTFTGRSTADVELTCFSALCVYVPLSKLGQAAAQALASSSGEPVHLGWAAGTSGCPAADAAWLLSLQSLRCCGAATCVGLSCPNKGSAGLGGPNGSSLYVRFAVEGFSALSLLRFYLSCYLRNAVEVNVACPNVPGKPLVGYDFPQLSNVVEQIASHVSRPETASCRIFWAHIFAHSPNDLPIFTLEELQHGS